MNIQRKHSTMVFIVFALLFIGLSGLFGANDAYSASSPSAYFKSQKLIHNGDKGWKLEGQIVNNSQTHQIVRVDYRKITYSVENKMSSSDPKVYYEENSNVNPLVVPPMGVAKWSIGFGKNYANRNAYTIKVKNVDMKFSFMPVKQSGRK